MKVRVKFAKEGAMKFIGHLDIMRYFQKAVRRSGIHASFSEGFSPHMIMSFAAPLGVGITSTGEYFDMELNGSMSSAELTDRFNAQMADGMRVLSVRKVPDGKASKAMSLVAAADYTVTFREEKAPSGDWQHQVEAFLSQEQILVWRKTKRSEGEKDIRPWIYKLEASGNGLSMQLSTGSVHNLKPELVAEAFYKYLGQEPQPFAWQVHRGEIYADLGDENGRKLVTLESLGEIIE